MPDAFRAALGRFATGVTIVTATDAEGRPIGVTANSFNSVSLDPPLVLWSLAKSSMSRTAFESAREFAIHVLAATQEELSCRFARRGEDKFASVEWETSSGGAPLLKDFAARFRCRTAHRYEGGDHIIFVGEVLDFEHRDLPPLLFHSGVYAEARRRASGETPTGIDVGAGLITENSLMFLIGRAAFPTGAPRMRWRAERDLSCEEEFVLLALGVNGPLSLESLQERLAYTETPPQAGTLETMQRRRWIAPSGDMTFALTDAGRTLFLDVLTQAKKFEDRLGCHFTPQEMADARDFLRRLIRVADQVAASED